MRMAADRKLLLRIYGTLRKKFGFLDWWPGDSRFEVIVGAILTQNTAWKNVEKAILNLKQAKELFPKAMLRMPAPVLAKRIRPAGYYNVKSRRLKYFLGFLFREYHGSLSRMFAGDGPILREKLLGVNGIGPETADSILLYAGEKPFFVVDAYTKRIFSRHGFVGESDDYGAVQEFFMSRLPRKVRLFNDYHAQIVNLGKFFCKRTKPLCESCPLAFLFKGKKLES